LYYSEKWGKSQCHFAQIPYNCGGVPFLLTVYGSSYVIGGVKTAHPMGKNDPFEQVKKTEKTWGGMAEFFLTRRWAYVIITNCRRMKCV
jgi:hypothetical protein